MLKKKLQPPKRNSFSKVVRVRNEPQYSLSFVRCHVVVLVHLVCYLLDGLCRIVGKVQVPDLLGRDRYDGKGLLVLLVGCQPHLVHHSLVRVLVNGDDRGMHPGT